MVHETPIATRGDLFINHITDLITFRAISATAATAVNDPGPADIYGGEAGVEFLATSWLTRFANYSYEEIGQTFPNDTFRAAPRFKWNAGLRAELDNGFNGEAAFHYVGSAVYPVSTTFTTFAPLGVIAPNPRVGSYILLNLRAAYRFWHEKAEFAVTAFNALNDRHKEHPLGDTIDSRVMSWLTLRF